MGRYITWQQVVDRYPSVTKGNVYLNPSSSAVSSMNAFADALYIDYAEGRVDSELGAVFTTPFSSNNVSVRDCSIDDSYRRVIFLSDEEKADRLDEWLKEKFEMLRSGSSEMTVESGGDSISANALPGLFSTTQDYSPTFGMDSVLHWDTSSSQRTETTQARN